MLSATNAHKSVLRERAPRALIPQRVLGATPGLSRPRAIHLQRPLPASRSVGVLFCGFDRRQNNAPSRRLILSRPLRAETNFFSKIKLIWVVQIAAQKISLDYSENQNYNSNRLAPT
jgi:hypothetical protein